jgi:ProP effector
MNVVQNKSPFRTLKALRAAYPIIAENKPLAIGTEVTLEGYTPQEIQQAIRRHVSTSTYLRQIKFGTHRFNLDGTQAEEIKPEHKEIARLKLAPRYIKRSWDARDLSNLPPKKVIKKSQNYQKRMDIAVAKANAAVMALKTKV